MKPHQGKTPIRPTSVVDRKHIEAFVAEVVRRFPVERVVLFGSYAYGTPTADSDVDLLVVMNHEGPAVVQAAEIRKQIHAGFPLDLLVRRPQEIRQRLASDDFFITEILARGETLYEVGHARVG
jgi:predicted nucleotidyltransferase